MKKTILLLIAVVMFLVFLPQPAGAATTITDVTQRLRNYESGLPVIWGGSGQCYGFVKYTYQTIFGVTVTWSYDTGVSTSDYLYCVDSVTDPDDLAALYEKALPGDILCWSTGSNNPHSTIVFDTSDGMVVLDANSDSANIIRINSNYTLENMQSWLGSGRTTRISLFRLSPGTVTLDRSEVMLQVGQDDYLTAQTEVDIYTAPVWFTNSPTVVSVGSDGHITALSPGTATVYCLIGDKLASCNVNTFNSFEMPREIEMEASTLFSKSEQQLAIEVNGRHEFAGDIEWSSSDNVVASVDMNGVVTAKKEGVAQISASFVYDGKAYLLTCTVTVTQ